MPDEPDAWHTTETSHMNASKDKRGLSRRSVVTAGAAMALAPTQAHARASRPNIVFILADDLGTHDLSIYGRPDFTTPHIDSLARDGVLLSNAYANSCTCSPTRTALISGRYQNRFAVGNYEPLSRPDVGFPADRSTLPGLLRAAGYRTALIGKWHLGPPPAFGPLLSGYQEFFGFMGGAIDYFSHDFSRGGPARVADLYDGNTPVEAEGYATDLFTDRAIDFMRRTRNHPFFLSLHYSAPHWPWQTPSNPGGPRVADFNFDGGSLALYAEMVQSIDANVGRVLAAIDALGQTENTIVVFTSDNGGERFSYQWPLRGEKGWLYEGGIRVPALVRWPAHLPAGRKSDALAVSMDWAPTLLRAANVNSAALQTDGVDLAPWLAGHEPPTERSLFWRTLGQHAVRHGPWKFLAIKDHLHLHNLDDDPGERVNLRLREPEIAGRLADAYAQWNGLMLPIPADVIAPEQLTPYLEGLERPPASSGG